MSNSVAKGLQDPGFITCLNKLRLKINNDKKFATLMSNSLAARLTKPGFLQILDELMSLLEDKFVTSMNDEVVCRLLKPGYVGNLKFWINKLGKDSFATFVPKNAAILEKKSKFPILEQWCERVTHEKFHTFMAGGIGQYLIEQRTNGQIQRWFDILELKHFCRIFGNKSVVARVVKKDQFSKLFEIYNNGGANKSKDLCICLWRKNWKGLRDLIPAN